MQRESNSLSVLIGAAAPMMLLKSEEDDNAVWIMSDADEGVDEEDIPSDEELEALLLGNEPVRTIRNALWPRSHPHPFHQNPAPANYPNANPAPDLHRRFTERLMDVLWWREHRHGRGGLPESFTPFCSAPTRHGSCGRGLQCPFSRHQQWRVDYRYNMDREVLRCPFHPYLVLRSCRGCVEQRAAVRSRYGGTRSRPVPCAGPLAGAILPQ